MTSVTSLSVSDKIFHPNILDFVDILRHEVLTRFLRTNVYLYLSLVVVRSLEDRLDEK